MLLLTALRAALLNYPTSSSCLSLLTERERSLRAAAALLSLSAHERANMALRGALEATRATEEP